MDKSILEEFALEMINKKAYDCIESLRELLRSEFSDDEINKFRDVVSSVDLVKAPQDSESIGRENGRAFFKR